MRDVVHLTVDPDRAGLRAGLEGRYHPTGMLDVAVRRREALIDRLDLGRMDGDPTHEAVAPGTPAIFREPGVVAIIGVERIDRGNARSAGRKEALGARHLVWECPAAACLLVRGSAQ